jgi:uncharacterized protein YcbK (DUF882 family)
MRAVRPSFSVACLAALTSAVTAFAQPPAHTRRTTSPATASKTGGTAASQRRGASAAVAAAYLAGKQALVGWHAPSTEPVAHDASGRPLLVLAAINRGETLAIPASTDDGGFDSADLDRVAHLLRAATGDEHPIDPRTLALVYRIQTHFGVPAMRVVSGYRIPKPGSRSNHGKGRAMDLIVPGVADEDVAKYTREVGFVGVGVYPASQFVHVDIRPRSYFWVDVSGPHMKNRERGILGDLASKSDAAALARGQAPIEPFAVAMDVDAALRARGAIPIAPADEDDDEE